MSHKHSVVGLFLSLIVLFDSVTVMRYFFTLHLFPYYGSDYFAYILKVKEVICNNDIEKETFYLDHYGLLGTT